MLKPKHLTMDNVLRLIVIILHLFIFVIGCIVIRHGATWTLADKILNSYFILFLVDPGRVVILLGLFIIFISFVGCCITCFSEDTAIYKMHCLFMVLIVICILAYCIDIFILNTLPDFLKSNLFFGIKTYGIDDNDSITTAWDTIQENRHCCGVSNYKDWVESEECLISNSIPDSCCKNVEKTNCGIGKMNSTSPNLTFYSNGCFINLFELINKHFLYSLIWVVLFAIMQMVIIFFTCTYIHVQKKVNEQQNLTEEILDDEEFEENEEFDAFLGMEMTETTKMIPKKRRSK